MRPSLQLNGPKRVIGLILTLCVSGSVYDSVRLNSNISSYNVETDAMETIVITLSLYRVDIDRTLMPLSGGGEHPNRGPSSKLTRHMVLPPIGQTVASGQTPSNSSSDNHRGEPKLMPSMPQTKRMNSEKVAECPSVLPSTR